MKPVLIFPPLYLAMCESTCSRQSISILCDLEIKMGHRSQWEKRLEAVWGNRLPFCKVVVYHNGENMEYCTVLDKLLCVPPQSMRLSCSTHSSSVLNWSFVIRTVCATHTLGSAVEGNGSIVTISLRNKLSAIHWGNYVSKHTRQSQCYTEQSFKIYGMTGSFVIVPFTT